MFGHTIIYVNKITKQEVSRAFDVISKTPLQDAMEMYEYGFNLRKGDPKYAHLPAPDMVEAWLFEDYNFKYPELM